MSKLDVNWIVTGRSTGSGHGNWFMKTSLQKVKKGTPRFVFTLYKDSLKELRWQDGDRVEVGDGDGFIALRRVPSGGYAVSGRKGGTINISANAMSFTGELQNMMLEVDDIHITEGNVLIVPKNEGFDIESVK